jgi:hypothetical protein
VSEVYLDFMVIIGRSDRESNNSSSGIDDLVFKGRSDVGLVSAENDPEEWRRFGADRYRNEPDDILLCPRILALVTVNKHCFLPHDLPLIR